MHAQLDLRVYRDLARDSGLSKPDYDVLSHLSETPGRTLRMNQLAARTLWSRSRVSHQVIRMERRGLVLRRDCEDDARGAMVVLTDQGFRAIEAAAPDHVRSVRENFIDLLTPEQLDLLADVADTVVDHLSRTSAPAGA
jgi:DNA-binding MarR family transcriptional regulator